MEQIKCNLVIFLDATLSEVHGQRIVYKIPGLPNSDLEM